jgi:transcriptional regulator with XRE-family HTH domain
LKIGEKIKTIRLSKGIKQIELAKMAGISNTYLSDIEKGRTNPSIKTLAKIVHALGAEDDWNIFLKENYVKIEHKSQETA